MNNNIPQPNQMGPNPAMNQMSNQPNVQPPYPNYPNQYPPRPPKQPMDPVKKKKIIAIVSICSGVAVLAIIAAIVIPILFRVDYSTAYKTAKDLKPKIYNIYQSYDCGYVVSYVDSRYTNIKNYAEYVENCKETYNDSTSALVAKLGETDGIKRNNELGLQYEKFRTAFAALTSGDTEELAAKLALWQARHNFVYVADDLSYTSSSDAEFTAAANYLIESGNDTLKTYGEGWLEKSLAAAAAYRNYRNTTTGWSAAYNEYQNKVKEKNDYVAANKPDMSQIAPLNFNDTYKMYSEFNSLYNMITETYEKNYNSGSGDCTEFLGEVSCG